MNDAAGFAAAEQELGRILADLSPSGRRTFARQIGQDLRRSQAARIAAQQNPDGSPYAPRKRREPVRAKHGRIKRQVKAAPMFRKIRMAKWLRADASAEEVAVGFASATAARIARVHQLGLRDRVSRAPDAPRVSYEARELIGFTSAELTHVLDSALAFFSGS